GLERWGLGVCNPVCNGPGHNLARPGTTWHDLAQVAGGRCRRTCGAYFAAPGARASGPGAPVVADVAACGREEARGMGTGVLCVMRRVATRRGTVGARRRGAS